jgi:hypothetical protein
MASKDQQLDELHAALGYRRLNRTWAKAEILLGLAAGGLGLGLGDWAVARPGGVEWSVAAGGLALFVLGGYLALAGHRSHLYQSNNELAAYLAEEVRSAKHPSS